MNSYEKEIAETQRNEAPCLQSGTHRAVFCYLLLLDSPSMVYEGPCGEISIFSHDRLTDRQNRLLNPASRMRARGNNIIPQGTDCEYMYIIRTMNA